MGWASYTLASQRLGAVTEGIDGLALAICIASVLTLGFSIPELTSLTWTITARIVSMGVLGVVVGFSLELAALRRLAAANVAILFSLNPAIAFAIGWLVLGQHVHLTALAGGLCVVGAGMCAILACKVARAVKPVYRFGRCSTARTSSGWMPPG